VSKKYKFGLVLSGGGVRGVAHIGVLKALEEEGIKPDVIAGTSAGAIIGAFYAAGISPDDILHEVETSGWFKIVKPAIPMKGFMTLKYLKGLLSKYIKYKNIEELPIPLYIAATNLNSGLVEVYNKGPLNTWVLASASVPLMFEPIQHEGNAYLDGGLVMNLPASPIRPLCDNLLGVNLVPKVTSDKKDLSGLIKIANRCFDIAVFNNIAPELAKLDWVVQPDELSKISKFDFSFSNSRKVYELGYEHTKAIIPQIREKLNQSM
jgi:NTE family protein